MFRLANRRAVSATAVLRAIAGLPTTHPVASPQKGANWCAAMIDHRAVAGLPTVMLATSPSLVTPPAASPQEGANWCAATKGTDHRANAGLPTLTTYHLATVGRLVLEAGHCANPGFQTPAVDLLATVGLLALVADDLATAGFPTLAADHCAIAGRPALATYYLATAGSLMFVANRCPSVEKDATTRRPNFHASPTQVSRPWFSPEIFGVLLQGLRLQRGRRKELEGFEWQPCPGACLWDCVTWIRRC